MDFPRVTEILRAYTHYEKVPTDILTRAATRGTAVHAICAGMANGAWIPGSMIDPEYAGYVDSFQQWSEAQVEKFVIVEKRYTDEKLGFSGQLDFVVLGKDDQLYLVDLKTSAKPQKTHPVQMGAYDFLLRGQKIVVKGAMLVYLDKDGDFPNVQFIEDLSEETQIFLSALDCWNYFNKRKKNGKREAA